MSAQAQDIFAAPSTPAPIVIIGAGPVGVQLANELHRCAPAFPLVIYGDENWLPYNRVRLSSVLAGETDWVDLIAETRLPKQPFVETRLGCKVVAIDRVARCVIDAQRQVQPYSYLVLATGSTPHRPGIPGIDLPGVFVFRDMNDVQQLAARRARTRRTVVLGAGLLGIEAARAMQRFNTDVLIVEHYDRLLPRQLDAAASDMLKQKLAGQGIQVILDDGALRIQGNTRVESIVLRSGRIIECDTVIVATGIRPNIELARQAGLSVGRGIRVDDSLRTSDANIFAVGECAEHRGQVYGLVAPGLEQAAVAAHVLTGTPAHYTGSTAASRLKVLHYPVFSMGEVGAEQLPDNCRSHVYSDNSRGIYRKLVTRQGRLCGVLALGDWDDIPRVQEAVEQQRRLWPWQLWQFRQTGSPWLEADTQQVEDWPANTVVCNCTGVTRGRLSTAMQSGCRDMQSLSACTGASTVCGSCKPLVMQLLGGSAAREPVARATSLFLSGMIALVLAGMALLLPGLPFAESVSVPVHWDAVWRDNVFKQISGYSLLVFSLALAALGMRKRITRLVSGNFLGEFAGWRFVHVVLGVMALTGFAVHTGGHFGSQLNFGLALSFTLAALAGAAYAAVLAREHVLDTRLARRMKSLALWLHIFSLWPLPVLLGFHIAQGYVF